MTDSTIIAIVAAGTMTFAAISDATILAMIAAVPLTLAAVGTLVSSIRNSGKLDEAKDEIKATKGAVQEIHLAINSRLDEWKKMAEATSFAAGVKHEFEKRAVTDGVKAVAFAEGVESAVVPIALPKPMSPKEAELMKLIDQLNHEIESLKVGGNQ